MVLKTPTKHQKTSIWIRNRMSPFNPQVITYFWGRRGGAVGSSDTCPKDFLLRFGISFIELFFAFIPSQMGSFSLINKCQNAHRKPVCATDWHLRLSRAATNPFCTLSNYVSDDLTQLLGTDLNIHNYNCNHNSCNRGTQSQS